MGKGLKTNMGRLLFCVVKIFYVLIFLVLSCRLQSSVVQIKGYNIPVRSYTNGAQFFSYPAAFYSTEEIMSINNPFTLTTDPLDPQTQFITKQDYDQVLAARGLSVVGIPETMITDSYYLSVSLSANIERPFFKTIDLQVLNGLNEWSWDGVRAGLYFDSGYNNPPATGTFNQAEQRFYVSDGRQYQVVPEPSTFWLLLVGGAVLAAAKRRRLVD